MAYLQDVERILGASIDASLHPVVQRLEDWKCSEFHAAVYIYWIIKGRDETDKIKANLKRLATSATKLGAGVKAVLNRANAEITPADENDWMIILDRAKSLGFDRDGIEALFDGFIAGAVTLKDLVDLRAALSRISANGSTLSR